MRGAIAEPALAGEFLTPCLREKPLGRIRVPVPKPTQVDK